MHSRVPLATAVGGAARPALLSGGRSSSVEISGYLGGVQWRSSLDGWQRAALFAALGAAAACSRAERTPAPATVVLGGSAMKKAWDWHGIIGTGQSLSVGVQGSPLRATRPSYRNLKLDLGGRFLPATDETSSRLALLPLAEPIRPLSSGYPRAYPRNIFGETPHTSMASQITALFLKESAGAGDYVTVHSVVGESGQALDVIAKGARVTDETGRAYASSLFEARAIARLAKAAQRSFGVAAVMLTHGETDAQNPRYAQGIFELWQSYNADLPGITGQNASIPLFLTQQSSCPLEPGTRAESALAALRASEQHPGQIVCVGPRYQYPYAPDGVHLSALGYDQLGEKYGQVYFERLVLGHDWRPLAPLGMRRSGLVVSIDFHVPVPPLTWDDALPAPYAQRSAWEKGRGFEVNDGETPMPIDAIELGPTSVNLRLRNEPVSRLVVRYAATAAENPRPGGANRWGQLRDSDPFVGATTGLAQPNHAVTFELVE